MSSSPLCTCIYIDVYTYTAGHVGVVCIGNVNEVGVLHESKRWRGHSSTLSDAIWHVVCMRYVLEEVVCA